MGLFVDEQGRCITFLSQNGETHIKAIRGESGNLTGLAEIIVDEYNSVIAEMNVMKADM